ncbi:keratin, type I cytoskeletal 13-like [Ambystoma mexicanum]|uniref:keratin, type I cytoskeletal 13-like n=1 Tax=Ambystoma mexicanum TaxID=8296 RepID=UPI0037E7BC53
MSHSYGSGSGSVKGKGSTGGSSFSRTSVLSSGKYTSSGGGGGMGGGSYGGSMSGGHGGGKSSVSFGGAGGYGGGSSCGFGGGSSGSYGGWSSRSVGGHFGGGYGGFSGGSSGFGGGSGGFGGGYGGFGGGLGSWSGDGDGGLVSGSEKYTMQNLNERLASYMSQVHSLEQSNSDLEEKIRQWYLTHGPKAAEDYSHYYKTIQDLQKKISDACVQNAGVLLQIDNARLTADDYKMKYDNELYCRQSVEADINGLRKVMDDLTLEKSDMEMQLESLREELAALKKNHEEEMNQLRGHLTGTVNVEMNAAPGINLQKTLDEMRQSYEVVMEKNKKELEGWFHTQSQEVSQQVSTTSQEIQSSQMEIVEIRRTLQSLEIDFQAQLSTKAALESSLAETEGRYCAQLAQLQATIGKVEEELSELRSQMECQSREYQMLLDIKDRLEQEIATYRSLLDSDNAKLPDVSHHGTSSSSHHTSSSSTSQSGKPGSHETQGSYGTQSGSHGSQSASHSSQTGAYGSQAGSHASQSGSYGSQSGSHGSHSGSYGSQSGSYGSQTGSSPQIRK